jgi:hypothetical protein
MGKSKVTASLLAAGILVVPFSEAAPPSGQVTIGNVPLPVNITSAKYQEAGAVTSNECAPQCIVSFAPVPAGKRLVVTQVSARVGDVTDSVIIERPAAANVLDALYIPKPYPSAIYLNAP